MVDVCEAAPMATRTCPDCGAQYVASTLRCTDCGVGLVDGDDGATAAASPADGEQVGYELDGWGNELKVTLEGMLAKAGIRRVWESGALVVSAADEEVVDALIATVEGSEADVDEAEPRVAFEIEDLGPDDQEEIEARLLAAGIAHAWDDEGALVVAETDEEEVTAVVEAVLDDDDEEAGGDGLAATETLSDLYVAVDRLVKDPSDQKLATAYRAVVPRVEALGVPYGFGAADWRDLQVSSRALADLVAGWSSDPEPEVEVQGSDDADDDAGDEADADDTDPDEALDASGDDDPVDEGDADGEGEDADDRDGARSTGGKWERAVAAAQDLRERLRDLV